MLTEVSSRQFARAILVQFMPFRVRGRGVQPHLKPSAGTLPMLELGVSALN